MRRVLWTALLVAMASMPGAAWAEPARIVIRGLVTCQFPDKSKDGGTPNVRIFAQTPDERGQEGSRWSDVNGNYEVFFSHKALDRDLSVQAFVDNGPKPAASVPTHLYRDRLYKGIFNVPEITLTNVPCVGVQPSDPPSLAAQATGASGRAKGVWGLLGSALAAGASAGVVAAGSNVDDPVVGRETFPARLSTGIGGDLLANVRTRRFHAPGFRYAAARDTPAAILTNPSSAALEGGWQIGSDIDVGTTPF